ncbi:MAG: hypothetical protein H7173_12970 [Rhodoferax sp.]|nr:hypothetical protein [Pseudorhodobacter sp.]
MQRHSLQHISRFLLGSFFCALRRTSTARNKGKACANPMPGWRVIISSGKVSAANIAPVSYGAPSGTGNP